MSSLALNNQTVMVPRLALSRLLHLRVRGTERAEAAPAVEPELPSSERLIETMMQDKRRCQIIRDAWIQNR